MRYVFHDNTGIITVHRRVLHGFDSLWVYEITIVEKTFYSLTNLAPVLGYRNPQNLKSLLSSSPERIIPIDELYLEVALDSFDSHNDAVPLEQFIDILNHVVTDDASWRFNTRSYFTDIDGILFILSHNTMTSDRVKKALCGALGIEKSIVCPSRPETHFCDRLSSILNEFGFIVKRQYQTGIYRLDIAVFSEDGKFLCAVEYDEDTHRWYDETKEHERENYMKVHRIKVLRADISTKPETVARDILTDASGKSHGLKPRGMEASQLN